MNTIELPVGNNMVPLRSDTIRLVQNKCSFHGLRSEDPNQHLKDFHKLVDSLDLDGDNRERTRLFLFQFSLRDQASNWLECLPAGSITTWEDLTTRFLAQFFPPGRTAKLRNDILMFQQHHEESLSKAWTRPSPQPQALQTTFEARVRDYMAEHTERMEIFKNSIFKKCEEINGRMTKIEEEERSDKTDATPDNTEMPTKIKMPMKEVKMNNEVECEPIKMAEEEETTEVPSSQPVEYYLKHDINKKLIEGFVDNHRFNDFLSRARAGKAKRKTYNISPKGLVYEAILRKRIIRKERNQRKLLNYIVTYGTAKKASRPSST
ncbi:zinc finger, CCHC-type containing protein [Tanacetum coccineum]